MRKTVIAAGACVLLAAQAAAAQASAAEPLVEIDLNKLEPQGDSCRAYIVAENRSDADYDRLTLDLVMFDMDGVVAKRLAVETAPLPADKTRLKVFDIDGLACGSIGRVLLNDVLDCQVAGADEADCLARLATRARGPVAFIK